MNEIPEKLSNLEDKFRANRFKEIIVPIFNSYENYLSKEKTIDFEDMILKAVNLLKTNENNEFKYSHILVDEFQDLSMARKNLLKSLLDLDDGELFGVGDDWQSINRFTGADVSLTLDFDTYFEYKFFKKRQSDTEESEFPSYDLTFQPPKIFSVAQTHRCSKNISNIASDFITMNPYQWSKDIESKQTRNPKIKFQTMDEYKTKHVITLINRIPKPNTTESIFVLYPYNRISKLIDFDKVNESFSNISIQNGTIHSAKGLEADHVILLGMDQGPWGFPMLLGEDPLRDAFLPDSDNYEYSEERRVFYVAMTRAKFNLIIFNKIDNYFIKIKN